MRTSKIAISIERKLLVRLDRLVKSHIFPSRSRIVQDAVKEKLIRLDHSRLAKECAKLDSSFEQAIAEEGFSEEIDQWPEY